MGLLRRRPRNPPVEPAPSLAAPRYLHAEEVERRFAGLEADLAALRTDLARTGARIDEVAAGLTAQFSELSREIEALASLDAPVGPADLQRLQAAQVHLAAEQARYQIALREELAQLASRIRP